MNSKHLLVVVALLVGFVVFLFVTKMVGWTDTTPSTDPAALARTQDRVAAIERDVQELKNTLEQQQALMKKAFETYTRLAGRSAAADLESAGGGADGAEAPAGAAARPATGSRPAGALTLEAALAAVLDRKMDWDEKEKMWKRIREAGLTDAVIAELENRVAANPKDPDAQTDLGNAYLKKIEEVPQGPESGAWANKADQAYDKALELNPEHWQSRFMKATALSFWPPVFGKQAEAVKHYETLVAQQERQTPRDGFDETYYFLGNMYQQMGRIDQAVATWQKGLKLFPDSAHLQQQIQSAGSLRR